MSFLEAMDWPMIWRFCIVAILLMFGGDPKTPGGFWVRMPCCVVASLLMRCWFVVRV